MNRLLAAIPFVFPIFVAAQVSAGPVKDDPARITPEMKAKLDAELEKEVIGGQWEDLISDRSLVRGPKACAERVLGCAAP